MYKASKTLSCVILDKDPASAEHTFKILNQYSFINVVNCYTNVMEALNFLSQQHFMLLVIDSGLLVQNDNYWIINKTFPQNRVVVTGDDDDAFISALSVGNYHFLNQPLEKSKILEVIRTIYHDHLSTKPSSNLDLESNRLERNGLFVKGDTGYVRIDFDEIDYIKAFGEYAKLYKGEKWTLLSCTLKRITELLPKKAFSRVHRSFTVRIGSISSFDAHEIRIGGHFVPIGRNYKKDFESSLLTLA